MADRPAEIVDVGCCAGGRSKGASLLYLQMQLAAELQEKEKLRIEIKTLQDQLRDEKWKLNEQKIADDKRYNELKERNEKIAKETRQDLQNERKKNEQQAAELKEANKKDLANFVAGGIRFASEKLGFGGS